jgi:hypothetical protein
MIYDYLFYKGYQLAKRLKNWEDTPKLFASMIVLMCAMLNFGAILFFIEGLVNNIPSGNFISLMSKYKYVSGSMVAVFVWWYYSYKGRWQRIVEKYESRGKAKGIHPVIVIVAVYVLSLIIIDIAAMYKNGDLF